MNYTILNGNCLDLLKELEDNSIDSICTDPPYGINFMGKKWDYDVPGVEIWKECLRVLKPGGHLLSFAGTRTQHRMAINIEDAGFEIRDMIAWVYSSGMPKSHNVSIAIDRTMGAEREVVGKLSNPGSTAPRLAMGDGCQPSPNITAPATAEAKQWDGWGTSLKPAMEPITVARKPLEGTVAANVLEYGTGGINIDGCRVEGDLPKKCKGTGWANQDKKNAEQGFRPTAYYGGQDGVDYVPNIAGRWPANLIHDGSDEVVGLFPQTTSGGGDKHSKTQDGNIFKGLAPVSGLHIYQCDSGSAARFFYCAKASKRDRNEGLTTQSNIHPTVKPTDLMRYLCRLITPPGGTVLDPFMGSGSTGKAALLEGFTFIGIDLDAEYCRIAEERLQSIKPTTTLDEIFV
jgi:site-specific DNA-methyltransferase (adenine-specific)